MAYWIAVHYDEIGLKGKNRPFFEKTLCRNLRSALAAFDVIQVTPGFGRIMVQAGSAAAWPSLRDVLGSVFGVAHFGRTARCAPQLEAIVQTACATAPQSEHRRFAVRATRVEKSFPHRSADICRAVGDAVRQARSWEVDLSEPELTCSVTVLAREALVSWEKIQGPGGLPLGVSAQVVCLLSGGIDSPVAAWRVMRRGSPPVFLHFHSYPYTERKSQETALQIARVLLKGQPPRPLYLVPLGEIQQQIIAECPAELRVLLYRRFMFRLAEQVARNEGALALVTGEALGQVASQTLENLAALQECVALPVLRPLIGFDKKEIVRQARELGTFQLRSSGRDDCCSYLLPRHPATKATAEELRRAEGNLPLEDLISEALSGAERTVVEGALLPPGSP